MTPEERVDAALEDSFPASDAPWWTLGVPGVTQRNEQSVQPPDIPPSHDVRPFPAGRPATGRLFSATVGAGLFRPKCEDGAAKRR
jgi:hypothetical protein